MARSTGRRATLVLMRRSRVDPKSFDLPPLPGVWIQSPAERTDAIGPGTHALPQMRQGRKHCHEADKREALILYAVSVCGRYQRRSDKQRIPEAFAVGNVDGEA